MRPTCAGIDHGVSNEWQTTHFFGELCTLRTEFFGRYINYEHGSSAVAINFHILVSAGEGQQ